MKKSYDIATGIATFTFDGLEPLTFDSAKMSAENEQRMLGHGIEARIGDMAALSRKQKDGSVVVITEALRRAEVEAGIKHYESGTTEWNLKGGTRAPVQNPTWAAIAAKRNVPYAQIEKEKNEQALAELAALDMPDVQIGSDGARNLG